MEKYKKLALRKWRRQPKTGIYLSKYLESKEKFEEAFKLKISTQEKKMEKLLKINKK